MQVILLKIVLMYFIYLFITSSFQLFLLLNAEIQIFKYVTSTGFYLQINPTQVQFNLFQIKLKQIQINPYKFK